MSDPNLVEAAKDAEEEIINQGAAKNGPRKSVSIVLPEEDKG